MCPFKLESLAVQLEVAALSLLAGTVSEQDAQL